MAVITLLPATAAAGTSPVFKLFIAAPGPYRVSFEELAAAGLPDQGLPSAGLGLFHEGHPEPVWVEDGGDGTFGPGDWLELIGEPPRGWVSNLAEDTRYNVYFLRFDTDEPLRMTVYRPDPVDPAEITGHRLLRRRRLYERDFLLQNMAPPRHGRPEERWYWARLTHLNSEPFAHNLDLGDLALHDGGTVDLRVELRGRSRPSQKPPEAADHHIEVLLNGEPIGTADWDGTESYLLEISDIAVDRFVRGDNDLRLRIPKRAAGEADEWLIDVVMLNWIEITYPRLPTVGGRWADFHTADSSAPEPMRLLTTPEAEFVLYGLNGSRMTSDAVEPRPYDEFLARVFHPAGGESSFIAVSPADLESPRGLARERRSRLNDATNRADYIMIVHRRLLSAIQPLATLHRSRGLDVEVVDIQDIYDEFAGGLARPRALRSFLEHAYHRWRRPAPRFVLLVGDASLNGKDVLIGDGSFPDRIEGAPAPPAPSPAADDTSEVKYTPYDPDTGLVNRNLVPTGSYITPYGHAASDNYFVAIDGDDSLPDMAIGRLAVVEPAEVEAIVDKTIRYVSEPEVGPWRRNILFLTNTFNHFHRQSRWVAGLSTAAGFKARQIYPTLEEPDNTQYTRQLTEFLDQGQLFVHYLGHGGRFVWETGRRDLEENRDLFNLEHLAALKPTARLPVVLSMTCFTAPFDHPRADSIGEKFLRLEDRGAIAVIASSQRSGPSGTWGQILLEELTKKGTTVGEAIMRAKHILQNSDFVATYNLLGDPAVPVALPAAEIALSAAAGDSGPLVIRGTLDVSAFSGELLIELTDGDLEILRSTSSRLEGFEFAVEVSTDELADIRAVRAYAWDVSRGIDAAGTLELGEPLSRQPPEEFFFKKVAGGPYQAGAPGETDEPGEAASAEELLADAVAWWSFEGSDDGGVRDRLGAHHGSLVDRTGRTSSPHDGALAFYGRGFVDFGSDPRLDLGTEDFTLLAWIRTRQARRQVWAILDKRADATGYHLFNVRGQLGIQLADEQFTNYRGPFFADGGWHHVAVSVDRDRSDGIRWFVDGREAGPRQDPTPHQGSLDNPSPLTVGGRHHGGGDFVGDLDEVAIFRRALNAREVERLYQAGWKALRAD